MATKKKIIEVIVIIPDAGPVLRLHGLGRLDILALFDRPVHIVDQVYYEITKPTHDPNGEIAAALRRMGNQIIIVETAVGVGFREKRKTDPEFPSRNLGEQAVSEYAIRLASAGTKSVPLLIYEDPDIETLPVFRQPNVHFLNTTALLLQLFRRGLLPDGKALIDRINSSRKTSMPPFDRPYKTKKVKSQWLTRKGRTDDDAS